MTQDLARLIAACINAPKFRGRKTIIELAQAGDTTAIFALESDAKHRMIMALRGQLSSEVIHALDLPEVRERDRLRHARAKTRYGALHATGPKS